MTNLVIPTKIDINNLDRVQVNQNIVNLKMINYLCRKIILDKSCPDININSIRINQLLNKSIFVKEENYPFLNGEESTFYNILNFFFKGDYWFALTHLSFTLTPTISTDYFSNGEDYIDLSGSSRNRSVAVSYSYSFSEFLNEYHAINVVMVKTLAKAYLAKYLKRIAVEDNRNYYLDTGNGPLMATPEGKLKHIPHGKCLNITTGELTDKKSINDPAVSELPWYITGE